MASRAAASRYSRAAVVEPVHRRRVVEQVEGELGHVGGMLRLLVEQVGHGPHAAAGHVAQVVEGPALGALDGVEQHAFPQGVVAHCHLVDGEGLEDALQDQGAGQDDVGPGGIEPGELGPGRHRAGVEQALHDGGQLVGAERGGVERPRRLAGGGPGHARDGEDRARGPDRHLEAVRLDLLDERGEGGAHEGAARAHGAGVEVIAREEARGEADGAELEAARRPARRRARPMSSSVLPPPMSHSSNRRSYTGSDWRMPRWMRRASSMPETTSISTPASSRARRTNSSLFSRLPHRAGGHRPHRRARDVGHPLQAAQGVDAPLDGGRRQDLHVTAARAKAHDVLLAGDDLEAGVADDAGHHEVERVGADVDGGQGGRRRGHGSSDPARRHAVDDALAERRDPVEHRSRLGLVTLLAGAEAEEGDDTLVEIAGRQVELAILITLRRREGAAGPRPGQAVAVQRALRTRLLHAEAVLGRLRPGGADQEGDGEVADVVDAPGQGVLVVGDEVAVGAVPSPPAVEAGVVGNAGARRVGPVGRVGLQAAGGRRVGHARAANTWPRSGSGRSR